MSGRKGGLVIIYSLKILSFPKCLTILNIIHRTPSHLELEMCQNSRRVMKEGCYNAKGKWDLKEECYFKIMQKEE